MFFSGLYLVFRGRVGRLTMRSSAHFWSPRTCLQYSSDGAKYLCELLEPLPVKEHEDWIQKVIDAVQKLPINSNLISREAILQAAQEVSASEDNNISNLIQVIDIFKVPKLIYLIERRKFVLSPPLAKSLHGDATDKANLFKDRYTTVYQRALNHELFRPPAAGTPEDENKRFGLIKVEYLLGLSGKQSDVVVLGLLTQIVEGQHHLEDDTGATCLDLSAAFFHKGLITFNCFVLVEGWYEDGVLHVNAMGLPPSESSDVTRALLGNVNYFGGEGALCAKGVVKLQEAEQENENAMFVIISDLWLDKVKVLEKLRVLFGGYTQFPPTAFIFCGNFLSSSHGPQQSTDLKAGFSALAELILEFPELMTQTKFIFVPGPNDPGPGNILPRPALPKSITENIRTKIPGAEFVSNPCRLLYCTQEIVVFREDIVSKMCRNCVYFPSNSEDIACDFGKTLISQAHLAPLPLHVVPIYWGMDHCLALHPTPDVIITADKSDSFTITQNNAILINPGSFAKTNFSFKVYMPSTRQVEDSQIEDEI